MAGYGIAALMGLLGGAGTGAYKGYDAAITDSKNAAELAEKNRHATATEELGQRQLDSTESHRKAVESHNQESLFVEIPGVGRVRKELAPYHMEKATEGANRERETTRSKALGEILLGLDDPKMQTLGQIVHHGGMSSSDAAKIYGDSTKPEKTGNMPAWQWQDIVTNRALDEAAAEARGERPGTRARDYVNLNKPPVVVPNLGPLSRTETLNAPNANVPAGGSAAAAAAAPTRREPEPIVRVDAPLTGEVTEKLAGAGRLNHAVAAVERALQNPEVHQYMGPAAQYKSTLQRNTPNAKMGPVPPAVTEFEGNLAVMANYTIKLITGAQMGEKEADRIKRELPTQLMQPEEFRNRMELTKRNIEIGKRALFAMALTGNQRQKAIAMGVAKDLGLDITGGTGTPAAPAAAAPPAPVAEEPWVDLGNGTRIRRKR